MARNLVLCCDGTSNQFAKDRTNVIKLFHTLVKDEAVQAVYYHPGIGTRAPTGIGTRVGTALARTAGLAFGYRLQDDIVDAYRYLMNSYEVGDRVYIFGFSRGAYTARVVAAMLHLYGLAMRGNDSLVPYAVEMLWALDCWHLAISTNGNLHGHPDPESIARFLHFGTKGPKTLWFNYRTARTEPWADAATATRYDFEASFPAKETPGLIEIDLLALPGSSTDKT